MKEFIKENKLIVVFCIVAALFFFTLGNAYSGDRHYRVPLPNLTEKAPDVTNIYNVKGIALAIAAGQHNFKATTALQWSIGAGHVNNDSAVSLGLGLQAGKVFISGNISGDGESSAIGISGSGTF